MMLTKANVPELELVSKSPPCATIVRMLFQASKGAMVCGYMPPQCVCQHAKCTVIIELWGMAQLLWLSKLLHTLSHLQKGHMHEV